MRLEIIINSIRVGSVRTFLDALETIDYKYSHELFYRGHSSSNYELIPSIYRNNQWIQNEDILHKEIILKCPNDFINHENTFQTLVKMQHYSLPTRLLDITTNPLIALYFACVGENSKKDSGEVVVLSVPKAEIRYHDSDRVSVISNISRRPKSFFLPNVPEELFNKEREIKYLLHEIKKEKPYFSPIIKRKHLESVVCVKPKLDNPRIIRQDGAFLLFGIQSKKTNPAIVNRKYLSSGERIIIISNQKKKILQQLKVLGITKGSIFPEIDKVAEYLQELYGEDKKS